MMSEQANGQPAQQQAVMLEECNDCCSLASGAQPEITSFTPTDAGDNKVHITANCTGVTDLPCNSLFIPPQIGPERVGHFLAIMLDDNPIETSSYGSGPATRTYTDVLTTGDVPQVARGFLVFNPIRKQYGVCMKAPEAAIAYSFANGAWTKNTGTSMVVLNLPKHNSPDSYPSADVPLDFVLNNATLGANLKLRVTIPGQLDTLIDQNKPFRIKNLAAGNYTVTVQLQKPKAGGGWEDVGGDFAHSSRTFTVQ